jgi:hypothetical protein
LEDDRPPPLSLGWLSLTPGTLPDPNPEEKTMKLTASLAAVLLLAASPALFAGGFASNCSGTYLMAEAGGATSLWTLEADGTFFATSSLQALLQFSDQQGSWEKEGHNGLRGAVLALVFDDNHELLNVSRVDVALHTVGRGCDTIAGSLEVREFTAGEDPLDPATDTGDPIATDTVTGRRVKARG